MRYLLDTGIAQEFIGRNAKVVQRVDGAMRGESDWYLHPGVSTTALDRSSRLSIRVGRNRAYKPEAPAKGLLESISINALRWRFRLVVSDFPGIVCILDGDRRSRAGRWRRPRGARPSFSAPQRRVP